ncbi:MAG: DUF5829 family protein [Candidatus Babeliales bacterium]
MIYNIRKIKFLCFCISLFLLNICLAQETEGIKKMALNRPQEPTRPYPYNEEEVTYENKTANVKLAGTLTTPKTEGTFPAVIIIAGSGPHGRDATVYKHKTMLVLADHLSKNDIAVLRFDKRGCGASTGNFDISTSQDFANDVQTGIEYLKTRKEINPKQIGLIGHSEGGIIAAMIAAKSQDIAFVVMLGCQGVNGEEILYEQYASLARGMGESEEDISTGLKILTQVCDIIKKEADNKIAKEKICEIRKKYLEKLSKEQLKAFEKSMLNEMLEFSIQYYEWLKFYITFDPRPSLKKIKIPILALFGERDLLVTIKQNLLPFKKALEESGNTDYTILQMPELNHRFQHCKIGTEHEYIDIEETISPEVLNIISSWVKNKTYSTSKVFLNHFNTLKECRANDMKYFDDFANRAMAVYKVPGTSIALIKDNKIVYANGFGYRDVENKLPVNSETIFAIGSCTKAFTVTALGILVDQKKLNWDMPIKEYLPDFVMYDTQTTDNLSLRDCLCHRSGLPLFGYDSLWLLDGSRNNFKNKAELIANFRYLKPSTKFREKWQYNNLMYILAGHILENISRMSWDAFIKKYITEPLDMHNTYFSPSAITTLSNTALAYEFDKTNKFFKQVNYKNVDLIGPVGSMHSNVLDMAQWIIANLQNKKINIEIHNPQISIEPQILEELKMPRDQKYCLGWFKSPDGTLWHSGGITGCSAWVSFMPEQQSGVVVLSNIEGMREFNCLLAKYADSCITNDQTKMQECEKTLLKKSKLNINNKDALSTEKQIFQQITSEEAIKFVGTYHNNIFGDFVISANDSTITGTWIDGTINLLYANESTLKTIDGMLILRFKGSDTKMLRIFDLEIDKNIDTCLYEFIEKDTVNKVFLNHFNTLIDEYTYNEIKKSDFLKNEFCNCKEQTNSNSKESWTGIYFTGENTYFEFFNNKDKKKLQENLNVGEVGIGFSVDSKKEIEKIIEIFKQKFANNEIHGLFERKIDDKITPWFYYIEPTNMLPLFDTWVMAYHADYLNFKNIKKFDNNIFTRQEYNKNFNTVPFDENKLFRDIVEMTLLLTKENINKFVEQLNLLGYTCKESQDYVICNGPDIVFKLKASSNQISKILKLQISLNREIENNQSYKLGKSTLRLEHKTAIWEFE